MGQTPSIMSNTNIINPVSSYLPNCRTRIIFLLSLILLIFDKIMQDKHRLSNKEIKMYPLLLEHLRQYGLEKYYEEILVNILNLECALNKVEHWSVNNVKIWIEHLTFAITNEANLAEIIEKEWIDGKTYLSTEADCKCMGISKREFVLLDCIRRGWRGHWENSSINLNLDKLLNKTSNTRLSGIVYGRLIVIGTKEKLLNPMDNQYTCLGLNNEYFTLYQKMDFFREVGNSSRVFKDRRCDVFRIGRSDENDIVLHGSLHYDSKRGNMQSVVSRFACRIEVCRNEPYACNFYASGFTNDNDMLFIGEDYRPVPKLNTALANDYLTTYGVKLWNPILKKWCEISMFGLCYSIPENKSEPYRLQYPYSNALIDGSIIDLCGTLLYFQSPRNIARHKPVQTKRFISDMNSLKPQCPVMMQTIKFSFIDSQERRRRELASLIEEGIGFSSTPSYSIPSTVKSSSSDPSQPCIFPSCGHIHGYHLSLKGKPCPLCRTPGEFVPLALTFDSPFRQSKPTHVFNPCGHAASYNLCETFASIPMFTYNVHGIITDQIMMCPFCAKALNRSTPYSRMIIQSETGKNWEDEGEKTSQIEEEMHERNDSNVIGVPDTIIVDLRPAEYQDDDDEAFLSTLVCNFPRGH